MLGNIHSETDNSFGSITTYAAQTILPKYDLGKFRNLEVLSSGYANKNYKVTTSVKPVLLREIKQKNEEQITYEIQLLNYLKTHNFPTAYPIPKRDGSFLNKERNKLMVLYDFLEGTEAEVNAASARQIGKAVGGLNAIAAPKEFIRANDLTIQKCEQLTDEFSRSDKKLGPVFRYFEDETAQLLQPLSTNLPTGLVHGDVFPDNTVFKNNKLIGIIDFEEACFDQLLFDVGTAINGFCYINNELNEQLLHQFLEAYHKIRPLGGDEKKLLPWFICWGAHAQIYWHLKYGLLKAENPKQLLRVKELMARVKWAQQNRTIISEMINRVFNSNA
ncbi:MAG: homoserine kinase [Gracilimonas sp.]|uniref:homoserine kinase n=1 Tax=Gracilimonas sp. TaxID=1974203 RepID=UPI00375206A2|nr:homoserine kinase [Gracilimonas sp.]